MLSFGVFLYHLLLLATSSFEIDIFDGSLRLLPHLYINQDLVPYRDFSVVYPPGYYLLLGKIIPFYFLEIKGIVMASLVMIIYYLYVDEIKRNLKHFTELHYSVLLIAFSIIVFVFNYNDPLSILLVPLIVLQARNCVFGRGSKSRKVIYFFTVYFAMMIRWDWSLFALLLLISNAIFVLILIKMKIVKSNNKNIIKKLLHYSLLNLTAIISSQITMVTYFYKIGVIKNAINFIYVIPTIVIGPLRYLPINFSFRPLFNMLPVLTLVLFFAYLILVIIKARSQNYEKSDLFNLSTLITIPLIYLPYALGRSGNNHFIPLWFGLTLSYLVFHSIYIKKQIFLIVVIFSLIPFFTLYKNSISTFKPEVSRLETNINKTIDDCKSKSISLEASSLFVGRLSYDSFSYNSYNNVMLYLTRSSIKPATQYISDEPGLQSSCIYGKIIAGELESSNKPMLAFLQIKSEIAEDTPTLNNSCGHIESYLNSGKHSLVGFCESKKTKITK